MTSRLPHLILVASTLLLAACESYVPPGQEANLQVFDDPQFQKIFQEEPSQPFPATLAFAHIQAGDYSDYATRSNGGTYGSDGSSYILLLKDRAETQSALDRVRELPELAALTDIDPEYLPDRLDSDLDIRRAAARVAADMVLIYTFNTRFYGSDPKRPLKSVMLGISPSDVERIVTKVSARLIDTRTGYTYTTFEATAQSSLRLTRWSHGNALDSSRLANEKQAFGSLVDALTSEWSTLLKHYHKSNPTIS